MRIENQPFSAKKVQEMKEVFTGNVNKNSHHVDIRTEGDSFSVSEDSKDILRFVSEIVVEEKIRTDKVDDINKKIEVGSYEISGKDVAEKLWRWKE